MLTVALPFGVEPHPGNPLLFRDDRGGSVRARLRHATADIHERLHLHPEFAGLMAQTLTLPRYAALLGRLYGFHAPLERRLGAAYADTNGNPDGDINPVIRERAHLLRTDLLDLGVSDAAIAALPVCGKLPALYTLEQRAGCLYVIEGAGLGGAAMARRLNYLLGPESLSGRRFFLGWADPDPMPWAGFCRWLEAMAAHADEPEIIVSARRTFEAIEQWLRPGDGTGDDNV
jgi:heme oxygenase